MLLCRSMLTVVAVMSVPAISSPVPIPAFAFIATVHMAALPLMPVSAHRGSQGSERDRRSGDENDDFRTVSHGLYLY